MGFPFVLHSRIEKIDRAEIEVVRVSYQRPPAGVRLNPLNKRAPAIKRNVSVCRQLNGLRFDLPESRV